MLARGLDLRFDLAELGFQLCHLRLEVRLVDDALGIAIDESRPSTLQMALLTLQTFCIETGPFVVLMQIQASFVFLFQALRRGQQRTALVPHQRVEPRGTHQLVVADPLASEAIGVGANAAVVGVRLPPFGCRLADRFAVVGVAAMSAHGQALQQVGGTASTLAGAFAILLELLLHGREQRFTD
jgi:hypothetical protein